jgi:hypothetical protein
LDRSFMRIDRKGVCVSRVQRMLRVHLVLFSDSLSEHNVAVRVQHGSPGLDRLASDQPARATCLESASLSHFRYWIVFWQCFYYSPTLYRVNSSLVIRFLFNFCCCIFFFLCHKIRIASRTGNLFILF